MATIENEGPTPPVEGPVQDPESTAAAANGDAAATATEAPPEAQAEAEPQPEPWTPERVLEWNRYYDLYVCAAVLLLVFLASSHKIFSSSVWTHIQAGRLIAARGPIKADPFSYTEAGRSWIDSSWLFSLGISQIHDLPRQFVSSSEFDRVGAIVLVAFNALVRAFTAFLLLGLCRRGPGLWWVAICVGIALGGMLVPMPGWTTPFAPALGGIAMPAEVDPFTWGLLLLAVEMVVLHHAFNLGRTRVLYGLVPLFVLWANVDESFVYGLVILALSVLGTRLARPKAVKVPDESVPPAPSLAQGLGVLGACVVACLVNPWIFSIFGAALQPYLALLQKPSGPIMGDQISVFRTAGRDYFEKLHDDAGAVRFYQAYFVLLVAAGATSFVLNRRRLSWGRLLVFAFAAVAWGTWWRTTGEFAIVLAAVLAWNGQEWYLDAYGTEGRLGVGWSIWSVGGRVLTLLAIFALIGKGLTGFGASTMEPVFGFGYNPDDFPFEAAEYLRDARISGNVLNTTNSTGDAIIWRAWKQNPERKTYIDSRPHVFPAALRVELDKVRRALRDKDPSIWRPILDKYQIQVVMLTSNNEPRTAQGMAESPAWIPFYDDGTVLLFGRADAQGDDLAFFKEHRLDAEQIAFHRDAPVPMPERAPNPVTYIDRFFPNRSLVSTQPHVSAAQRWLKVWGIDQSADAPPDIAHCLVAIREARIATARNPDDPLAWRYLNDAYRLLMVEEAKILIKTVSQPPVAYRMFRFRQRAAVLNYAIQTTPPPRSLDARGALADLNVQMASLYREANFFDLERDRLATARELFPPDEASQELDTRLSQLDEAIDKLKTQIEELAADEKTTPVDRADYALRQGAPGLAIQLLEEANESGVPMAQVKPKLLDLYCQVGEPDKALELFNMVDDPSLMTGAGTSAYRQGMANLLLGGYGVAASLWETRALPQIRGTQSMEALEAGRILLRGEARASSQAFQELPGKVGTQAAWEFELGLCQLEGGSPSQAGEHLQTALKLAPEMSIRSLLEYYLEHLGQPIPPKPEPQK
jgi:tetratricopeptide (TPR) repeat protein